jgi:YggT family protein
MHPILYIIYLLLDFLSFTLLVYITINLLVYFNVINPYRPFVQKLNALLAGVIEPILTKIRRYIKPTNGVDLSPLALVLAIYFLQYCISYWG